jgi:hypothetical protein
MERISSKKVSSVCSRLTITDSDWEEVRSHYYVQRKISKDAITLLKNVSDQFLAHTTDKCVAAILFAVVHQIAR